MNISLRRVRMDASQTVFITSAGTVLFSSRMTCDRLGYRSTTTITSVDNQGFIAEVGFIKWNENTGDLPYLCVGSCLLELRTVRDESFSATFRGSDGRTYGWKMADNVITLSMDGLSHAPIAITTRAPCLVGDPDTTSVILYVRPTGFHHLREIVATFILYEQLHWERIVYSDRKLHPVSSICEGTRGCSREHRVLLTKDNYWTFMQSLPPARLHHYEDSSRFHGPRLKACFTRSIADLTGELLRRHKYPSAHGGFGDIWKCDWIKDSRVIEVAVKVMRTNLTDSQRETKSKWIHRELKVWSKLEHECVLPLYGISFDFGGLPALVSPWLEGGTLNRYLEHYEELPLHTRFQLLSDIADGLHYLHGCGIVHGDLTGSNVLIKGNGRACLSDFGLSRIFVDAMGSSCPTSTVPGSVRWAAPELFIITEEQPVHALPNPQSDVYSFGSTMLQVLSGNIPYHYYKNDAQVLVALSRGLGPARPQYPPIDDVHWEFMGRCWSSQSKCPNKNSRPSIEEVVYFLSVARTCF